MRLSVPSYIVPGTYLENLRFLEDRPLVEHVELLFFYADKASLDLFRAERSSIAALRSRFRYSVHLPDALTADCEPVLALTADLADHYIVHPPASDEEGFLALLASFRARYGARFLLENLIDRPAGALAEHPCIAGLCLDLGHVLARGDDPEAFAKLHADRAFEVHLHGLEDGRDHGPLDARAPWLRRLGPWLRAFPGVVNLEVFRAADLEQSLEALAAAAILDSPRVPINMEADLEAP